MESFTFTIVVPFAPWSQELFGAIAEQMARYIGLAPEEAAQAGGVLTRLVAHRLSRVGTPVSVTFVRPPDSGTVRVAIVSRALPDDPSGSSEGGGLALDTDGRETTLTLSWSTRNGG